MNKSRMLALADLVVRSKMNKIAENPTAMQTLGHGAVGLGKGIWGTAKGAVQTVNKMFQAGGEHAAQLAGGTGGKVLGFGIKSLPYVGGAYLINRALDDPAGRFTREKLDELSARMRANQASYDPSTGMMY
jgi:hypothetical protein